MYISLYWKLEKEKKKKSCFSKKKITKMFNWCDAINASHNVGLKTEKEVKVEPFSPSFIKKKYKGMFSNCFFLLFFVFKNNFLFLRLKNFFGNPKWTENKHCSQNSICERNWKHAKCCFQFLILKSQWKYAFDLMNLSHLMN